MKRLGGGLVMGLLVVLGVGWCEYRAIALNATEDDQASTDVRSSREFDSSYSVRTEFCYASDHVPQIRRALRMVVSNVEIDMIPMDEYVDYLREFTGLDIRVNWTALEAAAIEHDVPVSMKLRNVNIAEILTAMCDAVGAGETELAYDTYHGHVAISTKEDLSRRTLVRIYDVKDLVEWSEAGEVETADRVMQAMVKHGGPGLLSDALAKGWRIGESSSLTVIVNIICGTVDPESWRREGGNVGNVQSLNNCLVIAQTSIAHQEIEQLLAGLRRARDTRLKK